FFCQAEDGIRDFHVTGVQTCALPILRAWIQTPSAPAAMTRARKSGSTSDGSCASTPIRHFTVTGTAQTRFIAATQSATSSGVFRSEERRVGKECRSRGTQHHSQKQR